MGIKIGEFFAQLGFKVNEDGINSFQDKMESLPRKFAVVAAAATGAVYALDRFVDSAVRGAVALSNFSMQTGLSAQELQKWQTAAQLSNMALDADSVAKSIETLQKNIVQLQLTGEGAAPFALLNIDPNGGAFSVLEQLRGRIQELVDAGKTGIAVNMLEQLGLGGDFINVLQLSRKEFDALAGSISRSQKNQNIIMQLGAQVRKAKLEFSLWKDNLVAKVEPALSALLRVIVGIADAIGLVIDSIIEVIKYMGSMELAMKALIGIAAILAIAFAPITAAIVGIILLLEDMAVYLRGGDSLIGRLVKNMEKIGKELSNNVWQPFLDQMQKVSDFMNNEILEPINAVLRALGLLPEFAENASEAAKNFQKDNEKRSAKGIYDFEMLWMLEKYILQSLTGQFSAATPAASQATAFNNNFYINSNGNPEDVATSVSSKLQDQYSYSYDRFNKGLQS
jgi:hypothetical protein